MKKRLAIILLGLSLLTGCSNWDKGSYSSVRTHETVSEPMPETASVADYGGLRSAILEIVHTSAATGKISVTSYDPEALDQDLDCVVADILANDSIAAYAVERITWQAGTSGSRRTVTVEIAYHGNRTDLKYVQKADSMDEARSLVYRTLDQCGSGLVMQIMEYQEADFDLLVESYANDHPELVMETPRVTANVYPEQGQQRVVELVFTYQTPRDTLRNMQEYVLPVFQASRLNVLEEEDAQIQFSLMYSFLAERNTIQQNTSITPAYSLLRYGVGDSRAYARMFAAMCRNADMPCMIVTGTKNGEPWVWNIIEINGVYYHVDILREPNSQVFLRYTDEQMAGYVWDFLEYPPCGIVA